VYLLKQNKIGGDKFSKTLSLPVQTWANLETVRSMTRWPDLSIALQDCIDSKYDSLILVEKMNKQGLTDIESKKA